MVSRKAIPQRTCVICASKKPKWQLIRAVATNEAVVLDSTGKLQGRGAYICGEEDCGRDKLKIQRLSHALRCQVSMSDWERLRTALQEIT